MGLVGGDFFPLNANKSRDQETPVTRLSSTNPDWFKNLMAEPELQMPVRGVQAAVEKALKGEKLGPRQQRVVRAMLDVIQSDRANPADLERARQRLVVSRHLREIARQGGGHAAVKLPDGLYEQEHEQEVAGHRYEEEEYDPRMTDVARGLFELSQQAHTIDPDAAETIMEDNARDAITNAEAARRYWNIIQSRYPTHESEGQDAASVGEEPAGMAGDAEGAGEQAARPNPEAAQAQALAGASGQGITQPDLFGKNETAQALHDERLRRDRLRNSGQESVETGDPTDLFSEARRQRDIEDDRESSELPKAQSSFFSRSARTRAAYERRIDELYSGSAPKRPGIRILDSSEILNALGHENLPLHLQESKVADGRYNHALTAEDWKKIPEWLDRPAAVFESDTTPGRYVAIAPEAKNGRPIRMVLQPNASGHGMDVHLLVNAYDSSEHSPLMRWAAEGKLRYLDTKSPGPFKSFLPRLAGLLEAARGSGQKLLTPDDLVKPPGKMSVGGGSGQTSNSLRVRLQQALGRPKVDRLEQAGVLKFHDTAAGIPGVQPFEAQGVQGYWDGHAMHLAADGIAEGDELPVVIHEAIHKITRKALAWVARPRRNRPQ